MYSDYQNDIKNSFGWNSYSIRRNLSLRPKEKSISSEPILLYSNSLFHSANRNRKALHVLTAGRSEMGLSTTTALDMLSGLFYDLTGMQASFTKSSLNISMSVHLLSSMIPATKTKLSVVSA